MKGRILIHEESDAIARVRQETESKVNLLNQINAIRPFTDIATLQAWKAEGGNFIQRLFFQEVPDAEKLSKFSQQEFIYPSHLITLANLLKEVNAQTGTFTKFNLQSKRWEVDLEAVETYCDKYRRFAETVEQKSKWKFQTDYCTFVNTFLSDPNLTGYVVGRRKGFENEMVKIAAGKNGYELVPRWQWTLGVN